MTSKAAVLELLDGLPLLVRHLRTARGVSLRQAADEAGLSSATFAALEAGKDVTLSTARAALAWTVRPTTKDQP